MDWIVRRGFSRAPQQRSARTAARHGSMTARARQSGSQRPLPTIVAVRVPSTRAPESGPATCPGPNAHLRLNLLDVSESSVDARLRIVMKLRVDPWDPEYGGSIELDPDLGPPAGLDLDVEVDGAWSPVPAPAARSDVCCAFIDGVRRIDAPAVRRGRATRQRRPRWLVGGWRRRGPRFRREISDVRLGRELVVGGGLTADAARRRDRRSVRSAFAPRSVTGATPLEPIQGLQNAMREAEATLAQDDPVERERRAGRLRRPADLLRLRPGDRADQAPVARVPRRRARPGARTAARSVSGPRSSSSASSGSSATRGTCASRRRRAIDGAMAGLVRLEVLTTDGHRAAPASWPS